MKRISAILLSIFILASNLGLTMNTHFCDGKAVESSFSIGLSNLNCGMPDMEHEATFETSTTPTFKPVPCCENQHRVLQVDNELKVSIPTLELNPNFVLAFVHVFVRPLFAISPQVNLYILDSPPVPDISRQVLFQTFLI